jgi:hypothetical protein
VIQPSYRITFLPAGSTTGLRIGFPGASRTIEVARDLAADPVDHFI